jgi:acyl transferase domain-containing protein/thioesterase domain-containing protein/aryl carrier-like protein
MEINMKKMKKNSSQTGLEIAVIGLAGRFPGANDIHTFWENLKNGVESITFFSDEELLESGISPGILESPNYVKAKGYIKDPQYFDALFFNYTPNEASVMDPQLRLFHECTWHALEDAGYDPQDYNGTIGLYAGYTPNILWQVGHLFQTVGRGSEMLERMNLNSDYFSTLICYKLNLKGPGITVNTACSTSLVAIHMGCRALLTGEADIALSGGVTIALPSKSGYFFQEGMIMSPDGRCRSFDAKANGTASGSGVAVVVLKRLVKAIKDGDHIYAVIKGTAINNDGSRKAGYTALSVEAQAQVIRKAHRMAEVEPESISYIETHGIGTPLGDSIEIEALKKAFSQTDKKKICRIGALKPNIGHLDAAAGAASFIKTVLALYHQCLPPVVNFDSPNPKIDFENSPFYVGKTLDEWKVDEYPLRAGVSCFGIGGTNAHVVLEEWPKNGRERTEHRVHKIILLSAKTQSALDRMTENLGSHFKNNPHVDLADAAYTLQVGRHAFNYRRMLVCRDKKEVIHSLSSSDSGSVCTAIAELEERPVVFMFPDMGSQYVNMGLELYKTEPIFREAMDHCFTLLESLLGENVKEMLYPSSKVDRSNKTYRTYTIFIFEYALTQLLFKGGIKPRAMIGDCWGEYSAACISGVFSLEDVLTLLKVREELLRETDPEAVDSVDPAVKIFEDQVRRLTLNKPSIPFVSSVTGKWITPEDAVNPRYWAEHLRQTQQTGEIVQFTDGLKELKQIENAVFVEIGPGSTLSTQVQSCLDDPSNPSVVNAVNLVPPPDQDVSDAAYLLRQIGRLWLFGVPINWRVFYTHQEMKRVPLPGYPFDKHSYCIEPPLQEVEWIVRRGEKIPVPVSTSSAAPNRPELKTPYVAPRNRIEEILMQMFEDLLGIRPIGIDDDLLELGVDSLKGLTFVNRFKEQWGGGIHITTLFESPTVAELAAYFDNHYPENAARIAAAVPGEDIGEKGLGKINKGTETKVSIALSENLQLLKETSPNAGNIFFIHEVSGDIGAYIEFCRLLDTRFNCWGIQAERLKHFRPQNRTIEEIAGIYIEKIKRIQPEGPYYLVTWSGGGPIVFEMALQMEQRGEPLALLVFIDCRGPLSRLNKKYEDFTLDTEKRYLKGFFMGTEMEEKLGKITHIDQIWPIVVDILKNNHSSYKEAIDQVIRQDRMLTLLNFDGQRVEDLVQYMNKSRTFGNASTQYIPARKLQTPLHFFEGTEAPKETPVYWNEYCTNPVMFHEMRGDHYSIFKQPLVKEFAHLFSEFLENINPKNRKENY